jgi:thiamine-monophosphate kinase
MIDALPCGPMLATQERGLRRSYALTGGDDYELCFTAPAQAREAILAASRSASTAVTRIGSITRGGGLQLVDADGVPVALQLTSFDHFSTP